MTNDTATSRLPIAGALAMATMATMTTIACDRRNLPAPAPGPDVARTSLVLVFDPTTHLFAAYNRDGQLVHDYLAHLDFGAGCADRNFWANGRLLSWDGTRAWSPTVGSATPGLAEPLLVSRIVMR